MRIVRVQPMKSAEIIDVDGSYDSFRKEIGGMVERTFPFDDPVVIICNEDGKHMGLQPNRSVRYKSGYVDVIVGTFLLTGLKKNLEEKSLSIELAEKYRKMFEIPEMFVETKDGIAAIPLG